MDRGPEAIAKFVQGTSSLRIGFPLAGPQMIMLAVNQDIDAFALDEDEGRSSAPS